MTTDRLSSGSTEFEVFTTEEEQSSIYPSTTDENIISTTEFEDMSTEDPTIQYGSTTDNAQYTTDRQFSDSTEKELSSFYPSTTDSDIIASTTKFGDLSTEDPTIQYASTTEEQLTTDRLSSGSTEIKVVTRDEASSSPIYSSTNEEFETPKLTTDASKATTDFDGGSTGLPTREDFTSESTEGSQPTTEFPSSEDPSLTTPDAQFSTSEDRSETDFTTDGDITGTSAGATDDLLTTEVSTDSTTSQTTLGKHSKHNTIQYWHGLSADIEIFKLPNRERVTSDAPTFRINSGVHS